MRHDAVDTVGTRQISFSFCPYDHVVGERFYCRIALGRDDAFAVIVEFFFYAADDPFDHFLL